ncbi:DNA-directed DNA polymerase [Tanacetum coccineum]
MAKIMEEYTTKTRDGYGSGIARPKIEDKAHFELKGKFLKELRDNTFNGSDHEDANEHIEKFLEIVDLFHIPEITQDQIMLRAFPMLLTGAASRGDLVYKRLEVPTRQILDSNGAIPTMIAADAKKIKKVNEKVYAAQVGCELCKGPHYTKDCPLKEEGKTLEEAYYTQIGVPFPQGGQYRAATLGFYQRNNANPSYHERRQSMEESLSKFITELAKRHEEKSNLIKEIRASTDASIRNQGASIKTLEIQIGQMSKVLQERGFGSLPGLTKINPRDHVKSISTTIETDTTPIRRIGSTRYAGRDPLANLGASVSVMSFSTYNNLGLDELAHTKLTIELADRTAKHPKGIVENVLVGIGKFVFPVDFIILDMSEDVKVPLILERPFLSTAHAKIDVFKRKITVRVGDEKIIFKSVKPASSLTKRVYILSLKERMKLDLEARLMGETLILNRLLDPLYRDYIDVNDLNEPLELRRNQVDDLKPTIEEGEEDPY